MVVTQPVPHLGACGHDRALGLPALQRHHEVPGSGHCATCCHRPSLPRESQCTPTQVGRTPPGREWPFVLLGRAALASTDSVRLSADSSLVDAVLTATPGES